jgi:hypothetical protein
VAILCFFLTILHISPFAFTLSAVFIKVYNQLFPQMFQEANVALLTEDQTNQLLSAFWVQANQTDNTPFNYEAIGHSYSLTVLSSRLKVQIHRKNLILLEFH